MLAGVAKSAFTDGAPSGVRGFCLVAGRLHLTGTTNLLRCGKNACSAADMVARTDDRPWGANNPVWELGTGPSARYPRDIGGLDVPIYVIVWVGDDPAENDGDPVSRRSAALRL